ncbi:MAG: hypothetical protein HKN50_01305 [Gammaproteobacteria bacterium]|nr:hypothetical protein [Gammaproteobacteria bacterium]
MRICKNLCLSVLLVAIAACNLERPPPTPEERVRATIAAIEAAAEERSLSGVMDHIVDDYRDHNGNLKEDLRRLVQLQYIRNQAITIFTSIQSLEINGDTAAVELSAAMAGRDVDLNDEANRLRADIKQFSVVLRDVDGTWMVESASWDQSWE